ncbi:unnamed protein product [Caretta caretta]
MEARLAAQSSRNSKDIESNRSEEKSKAIGGEIREKVNRKRRKRYGRAGGELEVNSISDERTSGTSGGVQRSAILQCKDFAVIQRTRLVPGVETQRR